jgi:hypothetical protein
MLLCSADVRKGPPLPALDYGIIRPASTSCDVTESLLVGGGEMGGSVTDKQCRAADITAAHGRLDRKLNSRQILTVGTIWLMLSHGDLLKSCKSEFVNGFCLRTETRSTHPTFSTRHLITRNALNQWLYLIEN